LKAPSLRVFFALWPDANARERLAAAALDVAAQTKGVAPPAANLHVTLAFIGDVAPERIGALCGIGASVAASAAPFVLALDCAGTFRGTGIAWAGASWLPSSLVELARDLAAGCSRRASRSSNALSRRTSPLHDGRGRRRSPPSRADRLEGHALRARCVGVRARRNALPGARGMAAWPVVRQPLRRRISRLLQRLDCAEDCCLDPRILVDVDVENSQIVRNVDVGNLSLEPGAGVRGEPHPGDW
jgi:2'-5' RNA ligase